MNELQEIIARIWRNTELCWACAMNVRMIAKERKNQVTDEWSKLPSGPEKDAKAYEKAAWGDLVVRARWASRFLYDEMRPRIQQTFDSTGSGSYLLPKWQRYRLRVPVSFSVDPGDEARTLEASFSPDDMVLRKITSPFDRQLDELFTALITASYKAGGMGITLSSRVDELRLLPEYASYTKTFDLWDRFIAQGLGYLVYGRGCFADTEGALTRFIDAYQGKRLDVALEESLNKYALADNDKIKAVGGLFALNVELLSPEARSNVEPDPVVFRHGTTV